MLCDCPDARSSLGISRSGLPSSRRYLKTRQGYVALRYVFIKHNLTFICCPFFKGLPRSSNTCFQLVHWDYAVWMVFWLWHHSTLFASWVVRALADHQLDHISIFNRYFYLASINCMRELNQTSHLNSCFFGPIKAGRTKHSVLQSSVPATFKF